MRRSKVSHLSLAFSNTHNLQHNITNWYACVIDRSMTWIRATVSHPRTNLSFSLSFLTRTTLVLCGKHTHKHRDNFHTCDNTMKSLEIWKFVWVNEGLTGIPTGKSRTLWVEARRHMTECTWDQLGSDKFVSYWCADTGRLKYSESLSNNQTWTTYFLNDCRLKNEAMSWDAAAVCYRTIDMMLKEIWGPKSKIVIQRKESLPLVCPANINSTFNSWVSHARKKQTSI